MDWTKACCCYGIVGYATGCYGIVDCARFSGCGGIVDCANDSGCCVDCAKFSVCWATVDCANVSGSCGIVGSWTLDSSVGVFFSICSGSSSNSSSYSISKLT